MFVLFILISLGAVWCIGFDYMYYLYGLPAKEWVIGSLCPQKNTGTRAATLSPPHCGNDMLLLVGGTDTACPPAVGPFVWYGVFALFFVIMFLILEEEMAPVRQLRLRHRSSCP
jgi:hypothetical protein